MKFGVFKNFTHYSEICALFSARAKDYINNDVTEVIAYCRRKGYKILLATAAPDFYVREIWHSDFVATIFTGCSDEECKGIEKLKAVMSWCETNKGFVKVVLTDHKDDAPLISSNYQGVNVLVNPDKSTLRFFRELEPSKFFLIEDFDKFSVAL